MPDDPLAAMAADIAALGDDDLDRLVMRLKQASGGDRPGDLDPTLSPIDDGDIALLPAQRQMWFLEQMAPGSVAYNVPLAVWVDGEVDVSRLESAVTGLVERHEVLRLQVTERAGQPRARIGVAASVEVQFEEVESRNEARRRAEVAVAVPFSGDGQRLRCHLWRVKPDQHLVMLVLHHLLCDGSSLWILMDELTRLYNGETGLDRPPSWRSLVASRDTEALRRRREDSVRALVDDLRRVPTVLELGNQQRSTDGETTGAVVAFALTGDRADALRALAAGRRTTIAAIVLTAYAIALEWLSGASQFAIAVPVADRIDRTSARTVGFLVSSVPTVLDLDGCVDLSDALERAASALATTWQRHDAPFDEVVAALGPERIVGRNPLCQFEFASQVTPSELRSLDGGRVSREPLVNGDAKYDLSLDLVQSGGRIELWFEYNTSALDWRAANAVARAVDVGLREMATSLDSGIGDFELLDRDSLRSVMALEGSRSAAGTRSVLDRILDTIAAVPEATAVIDEHRALTYADFDRLGRRFEGLLRQAGVGPRSRVAIHMTRCAVVPAAVLGVWRTGASFIPLADDTPTSRVSNVVRQADVRVLIVDDASLVPSEFSGAVILCAAGVPKLVRTGGLGADSGAESESYVVFTSGSTGEPRGVRVGTEGLAVVVDGWAEVYRLDRSPGTHLQLAPLGFDVFVGDLTRALCFGGTLVIPPPDAALDPACLNDWIRRHSVDTVEFVPAVLKLLLEWADANGQPLETLRRIFVGSDAWATDDCRALLESVGPDVEVFCSYGTAEASIDSTYLDVRGSLPATGPVPIGRPFPGTRVSVRDGRGRRLPADVAGELWIGGPSVAAGYLGLQDRERFVERPGDGERWFRTRDLVAWKDDGQLHWTGRLDEMIKVRGVRVDPGEIEALVRAVPGVSDAVVVGTGRPGGERRLACFVKAGALDLEIEGLRSRLARQLPRAAVPTQWHSLDRVPLNRNGKVDRRALEAMAADTDRRPPAVGPRTRLEELVAETWTRVLGLQSVDIDLDFFDAGGHSIQAARLAWRLSERLDREVKVETVMRWSTIRSFAAELEPKIGEPDDAGATVSPTDRRLEPPVLPSWPHGTHRFPPRCILLTGATGFIGSHILRTLIEEQPWVERILCPVRPAPGTTATDRLALALNEATLQPDLAVDPRLSTWSADLSAPDWYGDEATLAEVDAVINTAADVNFVSGFDALAPVNVGVVADLLRLASSTMPAAIHHLSTTSADRPSHGSATSGYNASKWVSEQYLLAARDRGFPTSIYRPGFVGPAVGAPPPDRQMLWAFVDDCIRLRCVPELSTALSIVPVDDLTREIVRCVVEADVRSVELVNPEPLPWTEAFEIMRRFGFELEPVSPSDWYRRFLAVSQTTELSFEPFAGLLNTVPLGVLVGDDPVEPGAAPPGLCPTTREVWSGYVAAIDARNVDLPEDRR